jgi:hypothetical protein
MRGIPIVTIGDDVEYYAFALAIVPKTLVEHGKGLPKGTYHHHHLKLLWFVAICASFCFFTTRNQGGRPNACPLVDGERFLGEHVVVGLSNSLEGVTRACGGFGVIILWVVLL